MAAATAKSSKSSSASFMVKSPLLCTNFSQASSNRYCRCCRSSFRLCCWSKPSAPFRAHSRESEHHAITFHLRDVQVFQPVTAPMIVCHPRNVARSESHQLRGAAGKQEHGSQEQEPHLRFPTFISASRCRRPQIAHAWSSRADETDLCSLSAQRKGLSSQ